MAATDTRSASDMSARARPGAAPSVSQKRFDETKPSFLTTEFYAMVGVIVAVLVATAVSDSLGDVRAWTLVSAVAIGYMLSRGLAKSGSTHRIGDDDH
jgi:hypothetical protein